MQTAS